MLEPNEKTDVTNQNDSETEILEDTTPMENEVTIPIKFNKEIKNITAEEAANLAQKGMKYDLISKDYEALKDLSRKSGKSVSEFIEHLKTEGFTERVKELTEKCGGDEALAQHIAELESSSQNGAQNGFEELREFFPEIKSPEDLPLEIRDAAKLKGTLLLDEYLRYMLKERQNEVNAAESKKQNINASIGSQLNRKGKVTPEVSEFLRGLWK